MNKEPLTASDIGKLSYKKRLKKWGKKGFSERMRKARLGLKFDKEVEVMPSEKRG